MAYMTEAERAAIVEPTLTVAELRALLATFPDDLPVVATWEGQVKTLSASQFAVERATLGPHSRSDSLFIDVD